jgi:hypothetical protein
MSTKNVNTTSGVGPELKGTKCSTYLPPELFSGFDVWENLTDKAKQRTGPENVSDTLDSVVRTMKAANHIHVPVFMCTNCEAIYTVKVTECDCHIGEGQEWKKGVAIFE